jgi:hypothetical protein
MTARVFLEALIVAGVVMLLSASVIVQTLIPVDARFPPPEGFTFGGRWTCEDPSGAATLRVSKAGNRRPHSNSFAARWSSRPFASTWTEITEKNQYLVGHYFVAYDGTSDSSSSLTPMTRPTPLMPPTAGATAN